MAFAQICFTALLLIHFIYHSTRKLRISHFSFSLSIFFFHFGFRAAASVPRAAGAGDGMACLVGVVNRRPIGVRLFKGQIFRAFARLKSREMREGTREGRGGRERYRNVCQNVPSKSEGEEDRAEQGRL